MLKQMRDGEHVGRKKATKNRQALKACSYSSRVGGLLRGLLKDGLPEVLILEGVLTEWHANLERIEANVSLWSRRLTCYSRGVCSGVGQGLYIQLS